MKKKKRLCVSIHTTLTQTVKSHKQDGSTFNQQHRNISSISNNRWTIAVSFMRAWKSQIQPTAIAEPEVNTSKLSKSSLADSMSNYHCLNSITIALSDIVQINYKARNWKQFRRQIRILQTQVIGIIMTRKMSMM